MRTFESKQDFCQWLGEFHGENLKLGWSESPDVVSVSASGEFQITLPFANQSLISELTTWIKTQQQSNQVAAFEFFCIKPSESTRNYGGVRNQRREERHSGHVRKRRGREIDNSGQPSACHQQAWGEGRYSRCRRLRAIYSDDVWANQCASRSP